MASSWSTFIGVFLRVYWVVVLEALSI